jgi:tetratricopeptide (TPR) repeat protein
MKTLRLVGLLALAIATAQIGAQGNPRGTKTRIDVPTFTSPETALEWAKTQLVAARLAATRPASESLLMKAASASKLAQEWKEVSAETQVEAALTGAEAFLGLNAPLNAQSAMARVRREDIKKTAFAAAVLERSGEAAELLGDRRSALLGYQNGLGASPSPELKPLLLYRAGMSAFSLAEHGKAAALLEEALTVLSDENPRASIAEVALGGAYVGLKDRVRAEAWLRRATQALDRRAGGGRPMMTEVQTFIPEPSDDELRKQIAAAEAALRNAR